MEADDVAIVAERCRVRSLPWKLEIGVLASWGSLAGGSVEGRLTVDTRGRYRNGGAK